MQCIEKSTICACKILEKLFAFMYTGVYNRYWEYSVLLSIYKSREEVDT